MKLVCSKKNLKTEIFIAITIALTMFGAFVVSDFMEFWIDFTREHEEYELDEVLGLVLGASFGLLYLSVQLSKFYKKDRARIYSLLQQLEYQSNFDQLTLIPNRTAFKKDTKALIETSTQSQTKFTLFYIDLDNFKYINDMLGYGVGDKLLIEVVKRLQATLESTSSLYRIGGDEFCIIKRGYTGDQACLEICNLLNEKVATPFSIAGHKLQISQTIGISRFPEDGNNYETLLNIADIAMFMGKKPGHSQSNFKDSDFMNKMKRRFIVQNSLKDALENKELYVLYQPKVDLDTGLLAGSEALVRWQHPVHGTIYPDEFITVAEETHSVYLIDLYVLERVCEQIQKWGNKAQQVAVNFSPMLFSDEGSVEKVLTILDKYQVSPDLIKLEITERTIATDSKTPLIVCDRLIKAGISISLDDFGSGYSSLSHMTDYPISELKIDRSFTLRICESDNVENTVQAIVNLATALNISVVAEGVETQEQFDKYKQLSCSQVQGYFIDKPLPLEEFTKRLVVNKTNV